MTFNLFGLPSLGQAKKVNILIFLGQVFVFEMFLSIARGCSEILWLIINEHGFFGNVECRP